MITGKCYLIIASDLNSTWVQCTGALNLHPFVALLVANRVATPP